MASVELDGPHTTKPGSVHIHRGSKKRIARIRMRDHMSFAMWCYVVLMVLFLFVGLPWMAKHPVDFHRHPRAAKHSVDATQTTHAP